MSGLSERLRARADYKPSAFDMQPMHRMGGGDANLLREAASLLDQYEEALRAADDLVRVAHEHPQGGMAMIHVAPALDAYIEARPNIVIYRSTRSDSSPSEGEAS